MTSSWDSKWLPGRLIGTIKLTGERRHSYLLQAYSDWLPCWIDEKDGDDMWEDNYIYREREREKERERERERDDYEYERNKRMISKVGIRICKKWK